MPSRSKKIEPSQLPSVYTQELQHLHHDISRRAALAVLERIRFTNSISLGDFLEDMKQRKELWAVLSKAGMLEFALSISGRQGRTRSAAQREGRTRITDAQKHSLREMILQVLAEAPQGLKRKDIAARFPDRELEAIGVASNHKLADKLRQPLQELVRERQLRSEGEKRLLVYLLNDQAAQRTRRGGKKPAEAQDARALP